MSEAIIIALIGIVPSLTVSFVTLVLNGELVKRRLNYLEGVASEWHHYDEKLQDLKRVILECQSETLDTKTKCLDLREQLYELEQIKKAGQKK